MKGIDFKGKTVVVTGGVSGIGKATAITFAEAGALTYILDTDAENVGTVAAQTNSKLYFINADVSNIKQLEAARKEIDGKVDILVSNAGIEYNDAGNLLDMPMDKLRRILEVNLMGAINCARVFMKDMPRGGKVVFVSSQQAFTACLPGTSYQASKNALIGLTHALAIEMALKGINVNAICPGGVATEGMGAMRAGDDGSGMKDFKRLNPMGRRAWPEEIAYPILFLCSSWASYITGSTMLVDGGMSAVGMPRSTLVQVENDPDA